MRRQGAENGKRRDLPVRWGVVSCFVVHLLFPLSLLSAPSSDPSEAYLKGLIHEKFGDPKDAVDFYRRHGYSVVQTEGNRILMEKQPAG